MAQQEKFNYYYTFQSTKFSNGIYNFDSIFYILFYFKKPFYAPCDMAEQPWENNLIGTWNAKAGRAEGASGGRGRKLRVASLSRGGDLNPNQCCNRGETFGHFKGPSRVEVVGASMVVSTSGWWAPR